MTSASQSAVVRRPGDDPRHRAAVLTSVRNAQVYGPSGFSMIPNAPSFEDDTVLPCCAQWLSPRKGDRPARTASRAVEHRMTLWHCYYLLAGPDAPTTGLIEASATADAAIIRLCNAYPIFDTATAGALYLAGTPAERVRLYADAALSADEVLALEVTAEGPTAEQMNAVVALAALRSGQSEDD